MLPWLIKVRQTVAAAEINDIAKSLAEAVKKNKIDTLNLEGKTIGITAGSRGISSITVIIRCLVDMVKAAGGKPVIIPAMGTHGGATPEGQYNVLKSLGITEKNTGAAIVLCVDTIKIAETISGIPVYCNLEAAKLDGLIVVNRIKQHTDFTGEIESGICKMLAVGLGSYKGALITHSYALLGGYEKTIREIAATMINRLPILFAVGVLENWKGKTSHIEILLSEEIMVKEPILLKRAKETAIKLPFDEVDVLIIKEIGKNISGTGMDTKVVGRIMVKGQREPEKPKIGRIVALDLTPQSHGNAIGVGLADIATMRLFNKIDFKTTSLNSISSMAPEQGKLPCILETDKQAVEAALLTLGAVDLQKAKVVYIKNTLELETFLVSEIMLNDIHNNPNCEVIGEPVKLCFNQNDELLNPLD